MSAIFSKMTVFTVALVLVASLLVSALDAKPAQAIELSRLDNPYASWTPLYFAPNAQQSRIEVWVPDGTKFWIKCWLDNAGYRWFFGQEYYKGNWSHVKAPYVKYQRVAPHC